MSHSTTSRDVDAPKAPPPKSPYIPFDEWVKTQWGRTRATGHRWRRIFPWLETVNILGRIYITDAAIAEFERRALRGELAMHAHLPPGRGRAKRIARAKKKP